MSIQHPQSMIGLSLSAAIWDAASRGMLLFDLKHGDGAPVHNQLSPINRISWIVS